MRTLSQACDVSEAGVSNAARRAAAEAGSFGSAAARLEAEPDAVFRSVSSSFSLAAICSAMVGILAAGEKKRWPSAYK